MSSSTIFGGLTFSCAGLPRLKSKEELAAIIRSNGGQFQESVTAKVNFLLCQDETSVALLNPYKVQFMEEVKTAVDAAHLHRVPILDDGYVDACLARKQKLDPAPFIIQRLVVDFEGKFKVQAQVPSALDPRVQNLIKLLFDQSAIDRSVVDLGVDVRRLSQITQQSIQSGYSILQQLEGKLSPSPSQSKDAHEQELRQLSEKYYGLIPHVGSPSPIKSAEQVKEKAQQLEALTDLVIAQRLLKEKPGEAELNMNPLDVQYRKLRSEIVPLEKYRAEYKLIQDMVNNTQSREFFQGKKFRVDLVEAFEIARDGENERFSPFQTLPHHRLLWHGSRLPNYIGILSQGIRIAPPEAPVTGYFLGKGAYFADCVSTSAQYCRTSKDFTTGLLLLCEVAMGRMLQIAHGKNVTKADLDRAGFHSLKCLGTLGPLGAYDLQTPDGLIASVGREGPTGVPVSELVHNEYVVYDPAQIRLRYLVRVTITELDPAALELMA